MYDTLSSVPTLWIVSETSSHPPWRGRILLKSSSRELCLGYWHQGLVEALWPFACLGWLSRLHLLFLLQVRLPTLQLKLLLRQSWCLPPRTLRWRWWLAVSTSQAAGCSTASILPACGSLPASRTPIRWSTCRFRKRGSPGNIPGPSSAGGRSCHTDSRLPVR